MCKEKMYRETIEYQLGAFILEMQDLKKKLKDDNLSIVIRRLRTIFSEHYDINNLKEIKRKIEFWAESNPQDHEIDTLSF
jgi:hypothetical protein